MWSIFGAGCCCWGNACIFSDVRSFFQSRFLASSFCSSNICVLSLVSTPFFIRFYLCLPVPFPTVPARATSHFSTPLILSAQICLISAIVILLFCSSDKEAASSARWWLFCGGGVAPSLLRAAMLLSTSLWARSTWVWLSQCRWLPAAPRQGQCPGSVLDR